MRNLLMSMAAIGIPLVILTGLSLPEGGYSPPLPEGGASATVWPFDPALYDVPDEIAGYKVLAVISADNTMCTPPNLLTLVVRAESPSPQDYLASDEPKSLDDAMKEFSHPGWHWTYMVIGPKVSLDNMQSQTESWNEAMRKSGCIKLGGPIQIVTTPTPAP